MKDIDNSLQFMRRTIQNTYLEIIFPDNLVKEDIEDINRMAKAETHYLEDVYGLNITALAVPYMNTVSITLELSNPIYKAIRSARSVNEVYKNMAKIGYDEEKAEDVYDFLTHLKSHLYELGRRIADYFGDENIEYVIDDSHYTINGEPIYDSKKRRTKDNEIGYEDYSVDEVLENVSTALEYLIDSRTIMNHLDLPNINQENIYDVYDLFKNAIKSTKDLKDILNSFKYLK